MAAVLPSSDSSDSDSETDQAEQRRLKEAAVDISALHSDLTKGKATSSDGRGRQSTCTSKPSLRPSDKSHDDENELKTTPEFRAHVAKKLLQVLDSRLDIEKTSQSGLKGTSGDENEADFRLFSDSTFTLKEGRDVAPPVRRHVRKHMASSSSDSESENERLASVAVSGSSILAHSAIAVTTATSVSTEGKNGQASDTEGKGDDSQLHSGTNVSSDSRVPKKKAKNKRKKHKTQDGKSPEGNSSLQGTATGSENTDTDTDPRRKKLKKSKSKCKANLNDVHCTESENSS